MPFSVAGGNLGVAKLWARSKISALEIEKFTQSNEGDVKEIIDQEKNDKHIKIGVASWYPLWRMVDLLNNEEKNKITILANDEKNQAKYLYSNRIYDIDKKYYKKYDIPSNFKKFKELKIDNTIIFDVYKRLD